MSAFGGFFFMSVNQFPVTEVLTDAPGEDQCGAVEISIPEIGSGIVPEIEFREIPVQVLFGAMVIDALHPPLEDAEKPLDRIGVDLPPSIFPAGVVDGLMACYMPVGIQIDTAFIGVEDCSGGNIPGNKGVGRDFISPLDVERPDLSAPFHHRDNGALVGGPAMSPLEERAASSRECPLDLLGPVIGLIHLHDPVTLKAQRADCIIPHGRADPVREEPGGVLGYPQNPG